MFLYVKCKPFHFVVCIQHNLYFMRWLTEVSQQLVFFNTVVYNTIYGLSIGKITSKKGSL